MSSERIAEPVDSTNGWAGLGGPQDIFYDRSTAVPLPTIVRGQGIYLWTQDGTRYIDVSSGPVISNIGHGNRKVAEATKAQAEMLAFSYCRQARTLPNIEVTARIAQLCGPGYERVFLTSGGSEAVDMALKFTRQLACVRGEPGRTRFLSCRPGYHGATIACTGVSGDDDAIDLLGPLVTPSLKIPAPLTYRADDPEALTDNCIVELERLVAEAGPETILAFIVEPVGGVATGANVPPDSFLPRVHEICRRHGILVIHDEVMCGAGRTGRFLASQHWPQAMPDIVILAKGLSAGYTPLGAMVMSTALVEEVARNGGFAFGHTYTANPLSCAVGSAVLDELESRELVQAAERQGNGLRAALERVKAESSVVGDVRGLGLLMALEIVTTRPPSRASRTSSMPARAFECAASRTDCCCTRDARTTVDTEIG